MVVMVVQENKKADMNTFNFYDFLDQNGYEKETIRDRTGKTAIVTGKQIGRAHV